LTMSPSNASYSLPPGMYQATTLFLLPGKRVLGWGGFSTDVWVMLLSSDQMARFHGGQPYQSARALSGSAPTFDWMPPWPGSWKLVVWNNTNQYVQGQLSVQYA
jgi:hypothetical protein